MSELKLSDYGLCGCDACLDREIPAEPETASYIDPVTKEKVILTAPRPQLTVRQWLAVCPAAERE